MRCFYDTCSLLNGLNQIFETKEKFYISNITFKEIENIKTSASKDADIKFKARRLAKLLKAKEDKYEVIPYNYAWEQDIDNLIYLPKNDDSRIIYSAATVMETEGDICFITADLNCENLAKQMGLPVKFLEEEDKESYTGFYTVQAIDADDLADLYSSVIYSKDNKLKLLINQYLIIKDETGKIVDKYKWTEAGLKQVIFTSFESKMFGNVKPKDEYQQLAMDSMKKNKLTMVRGSAGTGKSYLSFGYLFECLDKGVIDKIIIFCNTVATSGSAKLGYYPGSRDEKLLDSQIGNLLASKLGDKFAVEKMIEDGTLILLPMSDIRGYDTTGMKAGIYISEAQNLDIELMRLALQRIGEDSFCILDGDSDAQVDLSIYAGNNNGMRRVSEVFRGDPVYGEVTLQNIHRSRIARLAQLM